MLNYLFYICAMANHYDKIIKENFDVLLPQLLRTVLGIELPLLQDLNHKFQVTLEREMDSLKRVCHKDISLDYGLHWEVHGKDEDLRYRMLQYHALFLQRHKLPLKQFVIYLGNKKPKQIVKNVIETDGLSFSFTVVTLNSISKDLFLQSETPEGVILAILADFGKEQPEVVIRQILERLINLTEQSAVIEKYQRQLQILARLRKFETITQKQIEVMPIHYEIETDGLYLAGLEKGIEKGIEKGLEKGKEEGLEKGKTELIMVFIKKNPDWSDEQISDLFEVGLSFVARIRKQLTFA